MNSLHTPLHTLSDEVIGMDAEEQRGVPDAFLRELLLKHLFHMGELKLYEVAQRMGLSNQRTQEVLEYLRAQQWVSVPRRGDVSSDISFSLTQAGENRARMALESSQYVGPAPVTLDEYTLQVGLQSRRPFPTTASVLREALGDLVHDANLLPVLGSALNSGRAIYLFGHSGSGKTYLAERLVKTMRGQIWVPYAVYIDGEAIQVFDPMVHRVVAEPPEATRRLHLESAADGRWLRCERPAVITGGELTLQMLELDFDIVNHRYVAPPQMKANNGIFVIDDLGRQRVAPRDLLNRWITPLDRQVDYLGLHTGVKFQVPFDVTVIFSSNFPADELTDPAFSRRLGYKIPIEPMHKDAYLAVIAQACKRAGVDFDPASIDYMLDELHTATTQPYLPCIPFDVISKIRDRALYQGTPPRLSPALVRWAWNLNFGLGGGGSDRLMQTHGNRKAEK